MALAGGIIAMFAVLAVVGAYMVLRPVGQMTVKIGANDAKAMATAVGADGIAEQNNGVYVGVVLYFDEVRLKDASTGQWTTIKAPGQMDIVVLANKSGGSVLVQATIPQGTYDEIVLVINRVTVTVEVSWGGYNKKWDVDAQVNNHELHLLGPITVDANGVIVLITFSITRSVKHDVNWGSGQVTGATFAPSATLSVVEG